MIENFKVTHRDKPLTVTNATSTSHLGEYRFNLECIPAPLDTNCRHYTTYAMGTWGNPNGIKKVIFNPPATIVYWNDDTKTVVKCDECIECKEDNLIVGLNVIGEATSACDKCTCFDREKGLAMAIAKKHLGNKGNYYNEFKKWLGKWK